MTIILTVVCLSALALAAFAYWLPSFIMTGNRQTLEEAFEWQTEHYDTSFYEGLDRSDYTVTGFEGYELHAELLKNPEPSSKYVILSHGYTDNRIGSLKYARIYLELGFNCIIYDLRGHGENAAAFTTYGIREGMDLECLVDDTVSRYGDMTVLGLHGESLGSAASITALKYKPAADFVVADCGFSDIEGVFKEGFRSAHVPTWPVDIASAAGKLRYGYSLKEMRPVDALDENEIPILFIHGADDTFILPKNSEEMAKRTKGYKELYIVPGAGHAESVLEAPEEYKEHVAAFLKRLGFV
ncbi:MAG: alpha/beta hydrolase [Clostridia bacterium]|nr:alpha/beta hydrolase [Clostridia bacterium]